MVLAVWIIAAIVVVLWSLFAWALHGLLGFSAGQAGQVGEWAAALKNLPAAPWLDAWFPGWQSLAELVLAWLPSLTAALGAAAPWLGALVWLAWGVVTVLVVALAGVLHFAVRLIPKPAQAQPA